MCPHWALNSEFCLTRIPTLPELARIFWRPKNEEALHYTSERQTESLIAFWIKEKRRNQFWEKILLKLPLPFATTYL
jgi:hypothetical protein